MPLFALANAGIHIDGDLLSARGHLAGHARHRRRLRDRQAARASWARRGWRTRVLGGTRLTVTWPGARRAAPRRPASASPSRCWSPTLAFDGRAARRGEDRRAGDRAHLAGARAGSRSGSIRAPAGRGARAPARRHRGRRSSTSPTTSTPSATTSAAASTRRSRWSSTATSSARTAAHAAPIIAELLDAPRRRAALRLPPPAADRRAPATRSSPPRRPRRPPRRARSGRCTTGCSPTRTRWRRATSTGHAAELGLDLDRFSEDLRRRRHAPRVAEDVASADASGVSGTPTFFINGRRHQRRLRRRHADARGQGRRAQGAPGALTRQFQTALKAHPPAADNRGCRSPTRRTRRDLCGRRATSDPGPIHHQCDRASEPAFERARLLWGSRAAASRP